jgi:hypothetical protein
MSRGGILAIRPRPDRTVAGWTAPVRTIASKVSLAPVRHTTGAFSCPTMQNPANYENSKGTGASLFHFSAKNFRHPQCGWETPNNLGPERTAYADPFFGRLSWAAPSFHGDWIGLFQGRSAFRQDMQCDRGSTMSPRQKPDRFAVAVDLLKIARELWKKTSPTREVQTAEQRPVGTATATHVTTAQTAARAGHPGSVAATSLENPEANRQ